jgi:hypothetical protein
MLVTIPVLILLADIQGHLFMQHCLLLWDPSFTDFMKCKPVIDDFVDRAMTDFVATSLSNRAMSHAWSILFSFVTMDRCLAPSSCVTLVGTLLYFFSLFLDTPLQQNTVPKLCCKSLMGCGPSDTPSNHTKWRSRD